MTATVRTAEQLTSKKCLPCEGGVPRLTPEEANSQNEAIEGWSLNDDHTRIRKEWVTKDFMAAMRFIQAVAEVAEDDGHHPDLHLTGYRHVAIELCTNAIGGLSENDFIVAAKIDRLQA